MIDFEQIKAYRENNRIEAKKAVGGLPHSIWETYSAFANTMGGIILLGVEEHRDGSFHPVRLPDPEALVEDLYELLCDPKKVNRNIFSEGDITIEEVEGFRIVAIRVPPARKEQRPIYIDGDLMTGTYRRTGEGDYRIPPEEIREMLREAKLPTLPLGEKQKEMKEIVIYLTEKIESTSDALALLIGESEEKTATILSEMVERDIVEEENGIFRLKA